MARPTAHRLLTSLAREGLVDRDIGTGAWHLGPGLSPWRDGVAPVRRQRPAREVVHDLATSRARAHSSRLGAVTRRCACCRRTELSLRSHVLHEGIRFPLGVASAGLAILAHLPEREQEAYLSRADLTPAWGENHSPADIRSRIATTRQVGYATNPGLIVEGSWGMAAAVFDGTGAPAWALSLTGVESRFREERRPEIGRLLLDQAHRLTQSLRSGGRSLSLHGMPRGGGTCQSAELGRS